MSLKAARERYLQRARPAAVQCGLPMAPRSPGGRQRGHRRSGAALRCRVTAAARCCRRQPARSRRRARLRRASDWGPRCAAAAPAAVARGRRAILTPAPWRGGSTCRACSFPASSSCPFSQITSATAPGGTLRRCSSRQSAMRNDRGAAMGARQRWESRCPFLRRRAGRCEAVGGGRGAARRLRRHDERSGLMAPRAAAALGRGRGPPARMPLACPQQLAKRELGAWCSRRAGRAFPKARGRWVKRSHRQM